MPCRSYDDDNSSHDTQILKSHNNVLARVACRLAEALENGETWEWLILKDDKASRRAVEWYKRHKIADAKAAAERKAAEEKREKEKRKKELREEVLLRLTPEERDALGF